MKNQNGGYTTERRIPGVSAEEALRDDYAMPRNISRFLAHELFPRHPKGFTFDPVRWECPTFREGVFIVSLNGYTRTFTSLPSEAELFAWVQGCWHLLCWSGHFIGNWLNEKDGHFYLDISIGVFGLDRALKLAQIHRQSFIYYPAEGISIKADGSESQDSGRMLRKRGAGRRQSTFQGLRAATAPRGEKLFGVIHFEASENLR